MNKNDPSGGFKSLSEFLHIVRRAGMGGGGVDSRLNEETVETKSALTGATDSLGGFLVPELFSDQIYNAALEAGIVRKYANILPMDSDVLPVPVLVDADRSSSMFGGITLKWIAESAEMGAGPVAPALGQIKLQAKTGVALAFVSKSLSLNALGFETFMLNAFGKAIAFYEDAAYLWGSGVGAPLGIMNSPAMISVNRATMSGLEPIEDLGALAGRILPGSWRSIVVLISPSALQHYIHGRVSSAAYAGHLDLSTMSFLGRPVIVTEKAAAMGSAGDLILADFSGYVIGNRQLLISASDDVDYSSGTHGFLRNETCWRMILRVDGQPILTTPLTPYKGSVTLSHFAALSATS